MDTIGASVGLHGQNRFADVYLIQRLLNHNRPRVPDARELAVDGKVGPKTMRAIRVFQSSVVHLTFPDACVDPGGKTLKELLLGNHLIVHAKTVKAPAEAPVLAKPICFPLRSKVVPDYHPPRGRITHHRYFGADRKAKGGGKRLHAACALVVPGGTEVLAIDDGKVSHYEPKFFDNTGALVVLHSNGLVIRYGELSGPALGIARDVSVKQGQLMGYVGTNTKGTAMLHIEFYAGTEQGPLSRGGGGFYRRADLINPTDYLDAGTIDGSKGG
jgi:murein DD-endopeptidase MepM/ murein hydrolase activator NlpD